MSVKVPAIFEDSTGTISRLTGEIELFGSVVLPGREILSGNPTAVGNGASAALTWNTKDSGSALLDLTTPDAPKIVTAGVYAVTVTVTPAAITAAGYYTVSLALDSSGDDASVSTTSPASAIANTAPVISCGLTYFVPAGGVIAVTVGNFDGANSVNFSLAAVVQAL